MGLINILTGIFARNKIKNSIKSFLAEEEEYLTMSREELLELDDGDLYRAVVCRIGAKLDYIDDINDAIRSLNECELTVYTVDYYQMEVNNGGLCQFFANSSRHFAPYLMQSLQRVGANGHAKLFYDFVRLNNINVDDLSEFECDDVDRFCGLEDSLPFEEFDMEFYEMEELDECLEAYIRRNFEWVVE